MQDWQFKPCTGIKNKVFTNVLHWKPQNPLVPAGLNCESGKDCSNCGKNRYCGNCPIGCNLINPACYDWLDPMNPTIGSRGGISSTNLTCDSTGQFNMIGNKYVCTGTGVCAEMALPVDTSGPNIFDTLDKCKSAPCRAKDPGTATAKAQSLDTCSGFPLDCCYKCGFDPGTNSCNNGYKPTITGTPKDVHCWFGNCWGNCCPSADTNCCDQAEKAATCEPDLYGPHDWQK